ncbi:MAG: response regulator [Deltaproteobacteria bacterium]|nr:response regulator [Deltaproteobacteria bacterium]MBI4795692.1 response regulator [Deltaproteobacteria bacterium]
MPPLILLVDDDPLIRSLGKELLEHLGYEVEATRDGREALECYRRLGKVDLVILDYYLPDRDGLQVLQDLLTLDPGVRVLMASGFFSSQEVDRIKDTGAAGFIYKPYRLAELENRIRLVLQGMSGF